MCYPTARQWGKRRDVQSTLHGNGKDVTYRTTPLVRLWPGTASTSPLDIMTSLFQTPHPCQFPPISPSPSTIQPSRNMCLNGKMHLFANATMGVLLPLSVGSVSVVKHGYVAGRHSVAGIPTASRWRMRHGIRSSLNRPMPELRTRLLMMPFVHFSPIHRLPPHGRTACNCCCRDVAGQATNHPSIIRQSSDHIPDGAQ
jgi:hypothetical protein